MRAVVYTRQSLDRTGLGAAVERQRADCEKLCTDRGWTLVREYTDNDTSASSKKPRPAYRQMLATVERGEAEVIVAWHVDRLTRKLTELEELIELTSRTGVRLVTVSGDIDLSTDAGRLVGRILASVARGEVERKGARQSRAHQQSAELGKPPGGRRAFGYSPDGASVNPTEARLVREAYTAVLRGATLKGIAADWNARDVTTTMGNRWAHGTVRRCLLNPRNAARRTYRGQVVGPAVWPAIVDDETFDAAHALLTMPERLTTTGYARRYLLPGLARCGVCGELVMTGRTRHGTRTYVCSQSRHLSRGADPIDELVEGLVVARLSQPDAVDLLSNGHRTDIGEYQRRAANIRERLDDLATGLEEGLLTLTSVRRSSARLNTELAEAEAKIASLNGSDVLGDLVSAADVGKRWAGYDLPRKRAVIDTLMTVTLLSPKRGRQPFDPETVRIEWRGRS